MINIANVKFNVDENSEASYYIFSHTEITVSKHHQTKDMFQKLIEAGYESSYIDDYADCTVYGFENPSGLWSFESINDFFKAYKDNANDLQMSLNNSINVPFNWKLVITGVY